MDVLERVRQTALLGKDFLVWLWFKSEMEDRHFDLGKLGIVELWFDAKIILSMENDQGMETVTCIAPNHHFKEALRKGKKAAGRIRHRFTWQKAAERLVDIIRKNS